VVLSKPNARLTVVLTTAVFLSQTLALTGFAQSTANSIQPSAVSAPNSLAASRRHSASPYRWTSLTTRAQNHFESVWGVSALEVKSVESGQLIRFGYRILDPAKAAQLNDKKSTPHLIDEQAGVSLEVPTMENAGQLRQSSTPEAGRSYWMVFSNKGRLVKQGDKVRVVIGKFRADGLFVH
jgi:hypothetical protein